MEVNRCYNFKMYKRSKYGKLPAMKAEEIPPIKLLVDLIDHMDF